MKLSLDWQSTSIDILFRHDNFNNGGLWLEEKEQYYLTRLCVMNSSQSLVWDCVLNTGNFHSGLKLTQFIYFFSPHNVVDSCTWQTSADQMSSRQDSLQGKQRGQATERLLGVPCSSHVYARLLEDFPLLLSHWESFLIRTQVPFNLSKQYD